MLVSAQIKRRLARPDALRPQQVVSAGLGLQPAPDSGLGSHRQANNCARTASLFALEQTALANGPFSSRLQDQQRGRELKMAHFNLRPSSGLLAVSKHRGRARP